ncbi:hypothetical protein BP5796_05574 [Coleophoma crateriformis]|uniref:Zn(2)-C6 fungal-type domain-containing protein n=1 Tax=Coleophoma crateriformis TaxID=565419 RepID=A0A3D8S3P1_9HELO|nr:hypothetical protein BP5796_05574 [Coleophoma crateriformis]
MDGDEPLDNSDLNAFFNDNDMDPDSLEGGFGEVPTDQDLDFWFPIATQEQGPEVENHPAGDNSLYQYGAPSEEQNTFGPFGAQYATAPVPAGSMPNQPPTPAAGPEIATLGDFSAPNANDPPIITPGIFTASQTCVACANSNYPCSISITGVPCFWCRSYGVFCDVTQLLNGQLQLGVGMYEQQVGGTGQDQSAPAGTPSVPAGAPSVPAGDPAEETATAGLDEKPSQWSDSQYRPKGFGPFVRRRNPAQQAAQKLAISADTVVGALGNVIQTRAPTNAELAYPEPGVFHAGLGGYVDDGPRRPQESSRSSKLRRQMAIENMGIRAHPNLEEMWQVRRDQEAGNRDPNLTYVAWNQNILKRYREIQDRALLLVKKLNPRHSGYDPAFARDWNASEQARRMENGYRRTAALIYTREFLANARRGTNIPDPEPYESDDELNQTGIWTKKSDRRSRTESGDDGKGGDDADDNPAALLPGEVPPNTPFLRQRCRPCFGSSKGCDVGVIGRPCARCKNKPLSCVLADPIRPRRNPLPNSTIRRIIKVPTFSQQPDAVDRIRAVGGTGVNPDTYLRIDAPQNSRAMVPMPARSFQYNHQIDIDDDDDFPMGDDSGQVGMHLPPSATNRNPYIASPSSPQPAITRRVSRSATTKAPVRPVQDYDGRPAQMGESAAGSSRGVTTRTQAILESNRPARYGPAQTFVATAPAPNTSSSVTRSGTSRDEAPSLLASGSGRGNRTRPGRRRSSRAGSAIPSTGAAAGSRQTPTTVAAAWPAPGSGPVTRSRLFSQRIRTMAADVNLDDESSSSSSEEGQDAAPIRVSKRPMPSWVKSRNAINARRAREAREGMPQVDKSTLHRDWKPSQQGDRCWTCWRKQRQCTGPREESNDLWPVCEECFDEDEAENCMWGDPNSYNDYVANVDDENPTRAPEYAYRRRYLARQRFVDQTLAGVQTARTSQSWYVGAGAFYTNPGHIAQRDADAITQAINAGGIYNPYNHDNPNINQPTPAGGPLPGIPTALDLQQDIVEWLRRKDPRIRPFRAEDQDQICRERRRLVPNLGWETVMTEAHWNRVVFGMEHRYWSEHHVGNSCRCDVVPHNRGRRNFASCGHCRDRQVTFHNQKQSVLLVDIKQWFCEQCAQDAKREYISNHVHFKVDNCTCTGQMTVPWLCNLDRDAAMTEVSKRARLMNRYFVLQLQNRAACGHSRAPINTTPSECRSGQDGASTSGVWACKSCRDIVIKSTANYASDDVLRAAQDQLQAGGSGDGDGAGGLARPAYDPKDHIPAGMEGADEVLMTRLAAQVFLIDSARFVSWRGNNS